MTCTARMGEVVHRVIQLQGRVEEPAFTQLWCVRLARQDTMDTRLLHYGNLNTVQKSNSWPANCYKKTDAKFQKLKMKICLHKKSLVSLIWFFISGIFILVTFLINFIESKAQSFHKKRKHTAYRRPLNLLKNMDNMTRTPRWLSLFVLFVMVVFDVVITRPTVAGAGLQTPKP